MWRIWVRDSFKSKWRMLNTKDFKEAWEAQSFIDKNLDLGSDSEAVAQLDGEKPWKIPSEQYLL